MISVKNKINSVITYYNTFESYWGYKFLLKGIRHFGFYPAGKESLSMRQAQRLMEGKLAEKLALPQNSFVLDAGCGEGNVAIILAKYYQLKITGVDLLSGSIKIAKNKARDLGLNTKLKFIKGDYTKISFPKNSFDGIYTMETLVHVKNYRGALKNFFKFLKPKGRLVLFEYTITHPEDMTEEQLSLWSDVNKAGGFIWA